MASELDTLAGLPVSGVEDSGTAIWREPEAFHAYQCYIDVSRDMRLASKKLNMRGSMSERNHDRAAGFDATIALGWRE